MAQILGTGYQRAGKTSEVLVGATALSFASYNVTYRGDDLETPNFDSYDSATGESYGEGILGFISAEVRFGGDWDAGTNPYDDPPGLYPRDDLADVSFYTSRIDQVFWDFPYIRLRSTEQGSEVKGKVSFNCSGMNQGPFTAPTGSV